MFAALIIVSYAVAHTFFCYIVGHDDFSVIVTVCRGPCALSIYNMVATVFILVARLKFHLKRGNRPKLDMY